MPLDPNLLDGLLGDLVVNSNQSSSLTRMADRNATQGLAVIQNVLIQQHGGTADDAATMAALRTAIHIPKVDG